MAPREVSGGVVHDLPDDMRHALSGDADALAAWEDITLLARNEWICWVTIVKTTATRRRHIEQMLDMLRSEITAKHYATPTASPTPALRKSASRLPQAMLHPPPPASNSSSPASPPKS